MALAFTQITNGTSTSNPGTTASVAFANDVLYLVGCATAGAGSGVTGITGGGITWANIVSTSAGSEGISLWRGIVSSGASTGTLSITSSTVFSRMNWSIMSVTGSAATAANNGSDAIVQSAVQARTTSQTSSSVTLAAFGDATNNAAWNYVYVHLTGETITKEAAYSSLLVDAGTGISTMSAYLIGQDTAVTSTWVNSGTVQAAAAEIKMLPATSHKQLSMTGVG